VPQTADVNHDLIAAGHPRMHFEATSFLANLPPHWNPYTAARTKVDEGQTWAVGQIVSAWAAARLLEHRAKEGPWPEFAEYSCYACHHNLQRDSERQRQDGKRERLTLDGKPAAPGTLPWGEWYFSGAVALAGQPGLKTGGSVTDCVLECQKAMTFGAQPAGPAPDRNRVAESAKRLEQALIQLLGAIQPKPLQRANLRAVLEKMTGRAPTSAGWEIGEQTYLGLWCCFGKQPLPQLEPLLSQRAFTADVNGPANYNSAEFMSKL